MEARPAAGRGAAVTWQQFFIGAWMAFQVVYSTRAAADEDLSSGRVVILMFILWAFFGLQFYALSTGGFW